MLPVVGEATVWCMTNLKVSFWEDVPLAVIFI